MPIGALLAAVAVLGLLAVALVGVATWRDPRRLIRAEFLRERLAAGFAAHEATIEGIRWCWVERAAATDDAATLLLIHGYTGGKENWYRLSARLGRRYRLVLPDLPGWGDSERTQGADYGFAAQAARVAAFIDRIGGPVVLVGHSMGGGIAALAAARHPQRVSALVLLDAAGVEFAENAFGLEVLEGGNPFAVADAATLERYFATVFHDARARPPLPWPGSWAYTAWRRREAAFEQAVLDRIGRSDERFLPWQEAGDIRQPTLLVWGAYDRVIDPGAMERYAQRIPHARRHLLTESGHMTLMEQPGEVADAIVSLLEPDVA
ncbi:alpha/beta fold hydrolase [Luteimonas saliphila]|uniref:alpha/beta fold hydrolase n=1 Tax=Luteimonas saliphila TaxID=2804919 RepID=UPI00192D4BDB|nr:alpha/beta hydrolase [Luteimonas saliphila]